MKVIITGGTGLIGSALARDLLRDGHEVVILTRNPAKRGSHVADGARLVGWDAKTGAGWSDEADGADAIVNLAGETIGPQGGLWTNERKRRIRASRIEATEAVVDAIRRATRKPRMLLQMSAVGYYGRRDDTETLPESAAPGSDFLAEVVKAWEAASEPVEAMGVRRALARTGIVLAEKGGTLELLALPFRLFVGGPIGSGRQMIPWIHLDDQVGAMRFLIENPAARGPFNLAAPNPLSNRDFGNVLGKVLGRPALFPTPAFMLKMALGDMSIIVLEGQRAVPQALQAAGYDFQFPNLEGALRDLLK